MSKTDRSLRSLLPLGLLILSAGILTGCGAQPESDAESEATTPESVTVEGSGIYVQVPGTSRGGNVFDFSYTTANGTTVTCIVYDRSGDKSTTVRQGAGGPFCFEEDPSGGMIAPLPRPAR